MPVVDRGSHRIHYELHGRDGAPPLVLIMGMGFSSRAWHTLPRDLSDHFRVAVFDNRGTGHSTISRGLCRIRHMADDARAVIDHARFGASFIFGISMGGMIAQELALRHPDRVRALALGATFAGYLRSRRPSLSTLRGIVGAVARGQRGASRRLARFLLSPEYCAGDPVGLADWVRAAENAPRRVAVRQLAAVALHDTESRLRQLSVPTLVLHGDRDLLVPVHNARKLARLIPGARLLELAGAGHVFPVERPRETVDALRDFFLGHHPRAHGPSPASF